MSVLSFSSSSGAALPTEKLTAIETPQRIGTAIK